MVGVEGVQFLGKTGQSGGANYRFLSLTTN